MSPDDQFFRDRVLTVYLSLEGERGRGMVMHSCGLRHVGGRVFLIGTCADTGEGQQWFTGAEMAVPWDAVASVFSMTREQFERKAARHPK